MADVSGTSSGTATKQRMLRFTIFVKRHPSLTEEEFHDWWSNKHSPLIKTWLVKHNVHRYTQYHTPSSLRIEHLGQLPPREEQEQQQVQDSQAQGQEPPRGLLYHDGAGEIVVADAAALKGMVEDPYYAEVISPDEKAHLDPEGYLQTVGYEEVWVKDGVAIAA